MAQDSRRYLPRPDQRDSGDLPEDLRGVSFELAKFLRYEASRRQLCDNDGWVAVDIVIAELSRKAHRVTADDVYTVVRCSYSKDRARFELEDFNCKSFVRAADRDKYQSRSRWKEPGSSTHNGSRTGMPSDTSNGYKSGGGWDRAIGNGEKRQNGFWQNGFKQSGEFDGTWINDGAPVCRIHGVDLAWFGANGKVVSRQRIQSRGKQIILPPHENNPRVSGSLNSEGQILWEDGDVWTRQGSEVKHGERTPEQIPSTTASTGSSPGVSGCSSDPINLNTDAADDDEVVNVSMWKEMRVLADWDANGHGEGYLSLKKGELLNVKASADIPDTEEGWAFGESIQRHAEGWFPPTFVQAVVATQTEIESEPMLSEQEISSCLQPAKNVSEEKLPKSSSANPECHKGAKSKRRFSAPPARRSRSTRRPRQRWSHPVQGNRTSSASQCASQMEKESEFPQILDSSLAAAVPASGLEVDATALPHPPCSWSWDWPLTRHEKKARILLIDKQVLLMDRKTMQKEIEVLRSLESSCGLDS